MPGSSYLPITRQPFRLLAKRLGTGEEALLLNLKAGKKNGLIRRFGAVLDHRKIGFKANALVAWEIRKEKIDSAGKAMAAFPQVSHCYLRRPYAKWPYNLYTMVHSDSRKGLLRVINGISKKVRPQGCRVLFTLKEFKKTRFTQPLRARAGFVSK